MLRGVKTALTPREREVAALVADGMTNREIAERLVISERTAEYHVEQIRNKLGVRSRAQVAAWMSARTAERRGTGVVRHLSLEPPRDLVGRDEPFAALVRVINAAIDGSGAATLVVGEPGAGKSRLLAEIGRAAESSGLRVVSGAAGPAQGGLAYEPWIDALRGLSAEAVQMGAPWTGILAAIMPAVPSEPRAPDAAPELRRTRLFEAVARLLASVAAAKPLALLLDDLHYADADSLALLHYVVRTARDTPLALVGAARVAAIETNASFADVYRALIGQGAAAELPLEPLRQEAVTALLTRESIDAVTASRIAPALLRWAGGNPFFTLEAIRLLRDRGSLRRDVAEGTFADLAADLPERVRRTVLARLDAVPPEARRALEVLAVVGRPARLNDVALMRDRDELNVAEALGASIRAGIVREVSVSGAPGVAFTHELIREAMYQQLPAMTRAALHEKAAAALSDAPASMLAYHLTRAGSSVAAADAWTRAGDEAGQRFAYDAALESYRSALELLPATSERRAEIHERIGDAELGRGAAQAAVDAYGAALAATTDPHARTRLAALLAAAAGRYEATFPGALRLAEEAVATLERGGDGAQLANALVALGWMQHHSGDSAGAERTGRRALALARALDLPRIQASALEIVIRASWLRGDLLVAPDAAEVDRVAARLGDHADVPHLRWMQAIALLRHADAQAALDAAQRGLSAARRVGSIAGEIESAEVLIWALVWLGRYREGVDVGDATLPLAGRIGMPRWPRATADYLHALVLAGDTDRAAELAVAILDDARSYAPSPHVRATLFAISALVGLGRCERATAEAMDAERPTCETCLISWLQISGRREAVCGDPARALEVAGELERRVVPAGIRQYEGGPAHIRALAYARAGRAVAAAEARDEAFARYRAIANVGMRDLLMRELAALGAD